MPGWDLTNAPHAALAVNDRYLPGGSQLLKFSGYSSSDYGKTEYIVSDPIAISVANRKYMATITPQGPWTSATLDVIDTVTGSVLGTYTSTSLERAFSLRAEFTPTTTHPVKLKVSVTLKDPWIVLSYATLTTSEDYGVKDLYYNNTTVKNGSIIEGQGRGYASSPMYFYANQGGFTVQSVNTFANGMDTDTIHVEYAKNGTIRKLRF